MFRTKRNLLDDLPIKTNFFNIPRKKYGPHYHPHINYINELICNTNISKKNILDYKKQLIKDFPNVLINILEFNCIDQGDEGSCSFVAFLNMTYLTHNKALIKLKNWKKIWKLFNVNEPKDIAEILDKINETSLFINNINNYISYIPIRSNNFRELKFNTNYWTKNITDILIKYEISIDIYNSISWLYQIAYFIETLIDEKIPLEINSLNHSRVCIGYNNKELLFADSWGENYEQLNKTTNDYYKGGYSRINKWIIYSWVRDLVYYKLKK
jgi:hypothetical protein